MCLVESLAWVYSNKKTPARVTHFTLACKLHSSFNKKEQSDDLQSVYLQIKHKRDMIGSVYKSISITNNKWRTDIFK